MLSIKDFELGVIRFGDFIVGKKAWKYKMSTLLDTYIKVYNKGLY